MLIVWWVCVEFSAAREKSCANAASISPAGRGRRAVRRVLALTDGALVFAAYILFYGSIEILNGVPSRVRLTAARSSVRS